MTAEGLEPPTYRSGVCRSTFELYSLTNCPVDALALNLGQGFGLKELALLIGGCVLGRWVVGGVRLVRRKFI